MGAIWQYGLSTFSDWASWRKLEPGLRMAIASKDLDMAACYCDRYEMAAVTPVITSIIREMKVSPGRGLSHLSRIKRAWRGASRAQLSRLTAPVKYLQVVAFVTPLAALSAMALDGAGAFWEPHGFVAVESRMAGDLPLLIIALSISVLSFLAQQTMALRARELRRVIDDLATDLIIAFLENGEKAEVNAYQPGKWMRFDEARAAAPPASSRGGPD